MRAVITGAADGIGKALAAEGIRRGFNVTGIDVDALRADQTQQALGEWANFLIADLTDSREITRLTHDISAKASINVLIHNAGISEVGHFQNTNLERQQAVISLNLLAPMLLTRALLSEQALAPNASIVFISSLSRYVSYPGASVYAATKDGIASYARSLRVAYPQMHTLTVYPGPTRTAHARRYSPDNSREASRMPPQALAERTWRAVNRRQDVLIPGPANLTFAALGRWFPALTDILMRKSLLEKFEK